MNISIKAEGDALASSPPRPLLADSSLDLKHARMDGVDLPFSEVWSVTSLVPTQMNVEGEGNVPSPSDPRSRSLSESPIALLLLLRYAPDLLCAGVVNSRMGSMMTGPARGSRCLLIARKPPQINARRR